MKIEIGRKDSIWSLIGVLFSMCSNLIILPFLLYFLDDEEVGLYYVFISLYVLTTLIDFGFSPSFARNMAYAWSGADKLKKIGVAESKSNEPNWDLIKKIESSCKMIYLILSSFTLIIAITIGNFYILQITNSFDGNSQIIAWNIFALAMFLALLYGYYSAFLRGVGAVSQINIATTKARIIQIIVCIGTLFLGFGLIGVSIAYLLYGISFRLFARRMFYSYENIGNKLNEIKYKVSFKDNMDIIKTLWPNTWREGLITLSNYILNQATVLIASIYLSLSDTGVYSLSVQLVTAVAAIAGTLYTAYQPALQSSYANRNIEKQKENIAIMVSSFTYLFWIGIIILILLGIPIIKFLKPTYVIKVSVLFLLGIYHYILRYRDCFCSYYAATNRLIYTKSFVISAIICLVFSLFFITILDLGIFGLIMAQILSQTVYNMWYWSLKAHKELKISIRLILIDGPRFVLNDFLKNI